MQCRRALRSELLLHGHDPLAGRAHAPDASLAGPCHDGVCSPFVVRAGPQHTCASIAHGAQGGSTVCWGRNDAHQVSPSEAASVVRPERVPFRFASSIAPSGAHTCAVDSPWLACWGSNTAGLLGWPDVDATYAEQVPFAQAGAPLVVTTGAAHTCTLDDDARVRCFGDNAFGQLGEVDEPYLVQRGSWLTLPGEIRALDAGGLRTCAWDDAGSQLLCWGRGETRDEMEPWVVPCVSAIDGDALSVGPSHACVITGGAVHCWGSNAHGELGSRDGEGVDLPAPARQISAGGWLPIELTGPTEIEYGAPSPAHTCALLEKRGLVLGCQRAGPARRRHDPESLRPGAGSARRARPLSVGRRRPHLRDRRRRHHLLGRQRARPARGRPRPPLQLRSPPHRALKVAHRHVKMSVRRKFGNGAR